MKTLTGKTFAAAIIAGLLALASVENHAGALELYLDDAMHTQVFQELKNNVQRLYESAVIVPVKGDEDKNVRTERFGFPVANRGSDFTHPYRLDVLN